MSQANNMPFMATFPIRGYLGPSSNTRSESDQSDMCIVDMPNLEEYLRTKLALHHDSSHNVGQEPADPVVCSDWIRPTEASSKPKRAENLISKSLSFLRMNSTSHAASEQESTAFTTTATTTTNTTESTSCRTYADPTADAHQLTTYACSINASSCIPYHMPNLVVTSATGEAAVPSVVSASTSVDGSSLHNCFIDSVRDSADGEEISSSSHGRLPRWMRDAQTAVQASFSHIVPFKRHDATK
jgi:hypothetical protein